MKTKIYTNDKIIKSIIVQVSQSGQRLDYILSTSLPDYSRSQIKRWILNKKVIVNNQVSILPKKKLMCGQLIEIKNINKNNTDLDNNIIPQNIPLNIIYEDSDIVVINKSSNMIVHPGSGNYKDTILNALVYRYPCTMKISERAGIVQRLDKDTTGLMVIAKTCVAYNKLLESFKKRQVIKKYDAIVYGKFFDNIGIIDKPIGRHAVRRTCMTVHAMGKPAITHYFVKEMFSMHSRVCLHLKTGRTHQIRVHMAHINHPLVGDQKYGRCTSFCTGISDALNHYLRHFNRQALHACTLQLLHPITQVKMKWHVPLPQDMIDLINMLKMN